MFGEKVFLIQKDVDERRKQRNPPTKVIGNKKISYHRVVRMRRKMLKR